MIPYRDVDGDSGVEAYEIGENYIDVKFKAGSIYRYTSASAGATNLDKMVAFALAGTGLNAFINTVVKRNYSAKLQ